MGYTTKHGLVLAGVIRYKDMIMYITRDFGKPIQYQRGMNVKLLVDFDWMSLDILWT